ncbi:serine/arginine repetitive matrix protein 1-like [Hippoglossus hippoglossus]|uniref:serine/arginine repetitive matrix protein 1-like n=1 Tax=Hippoglossus hippoglossus TaxID=8267 RepID=UPI00148DFA08|nr:serine/arginine repetitive matrix protein 1-like [Hippoglossus hippoglossus]
MQSQGSTSTQACFDSLSSSDSLLFSELDQVEDDADVFLTDGSSSGGATANGDRGSESPGSQWTCDGFTDKEEEEESYRLESGGKEADETGPSSQAAKSHGDLQFAQKCAELQGFVRPLLELLSGLKRGRFERGLSTFQRSVAMDRIQRIVGVLQRPNSGEKYLNTLLQVEMMLKLWFPQISTPPVSSNSSVATSSALSLQDTSSSTPPHKHRDQLHIPVKKRRLSWTGTCTPTPSPLLLKCPHVRTEEKRVKRDHDERDKPSAPPPPPPSLASDANQISPDVAGDRQLTANTKGKDNDSEDRGKLSNYKAGQSSEPSLTWVHVAPILSPRKAHPSHEGAAAGSNGENQPISATPPPSRRGSPTRKNKAISSSKPSKRPKNLKEPTPCQSQPVAGQQSENATVAACQGQSQSPLPRACPSPVKT